MKQKTRASNEKSRQTRGNRTGAFLFALLILLCLCRSAGADYYSPAPPPGNIVSQTSVSVALIAPARSVFLNVSEYDAKQMIKNVTLNFREPITYVDLIIDILKEKPLIVDEPKTIPVIQYYSIRFLTEQMDNITDVTIVFAVEKATMQNVSIEENSILHYRYDGKEFQTCQTRKVGEDEDFVFFETEAEASSCFAIAGATVPAPWWPFPLAIAAVTISAIIGMYFYRRHRLEHLKDPVRT